MLEPYEGKLSSTVLRRGKAGNRFFLSDVDIKIHSIFLLISFFSELLKFNLNQKLLNVNHNIINIYLQ